MRLLIIQFLSVSTLTISRTTQLIPLSAELYYLFTYHTPQKPNYTEVFISQQDLGSFCMAKVIFIRNKSAFASYFTHTHMQLLFISKVKLLLSNMDSKQSQVLGKYFLSFESLKEPSRAK